MQQRRRPISGRPEGTDGFDYSYRMTVDPRYINVTKGKAHLRYAIALQAVVQLLGVLYVFIFPPKAGPYNAFTVSAVVAGALLCTIGEIGRRRSNMLLLNVYRHLSPVATLAAVAVTAKHSLQFKFDKERSDAQSVWTEPVDIFSYAHIVLGALVELFQVHTTINLVRNMAPSRNS